MARGCDNTKMNHNNPTQQQHLECDVPTIHIKDGGDDDDEDDDAQVFLQHLGTNYGITARSKTSRRSITLSKEESRVGSAVSTAVSRQKSSRTLIDVTTRLTQGNEGQLYRLLSAKRNHIQELSSDVIFLHNRIKELEEQNRLLVRMGKRQEAALTRYQDTKSELPHIIEAHKIEINVLQEKLRRSTEVNRRNGEKLKVTDSRVNKLTDELTRLRELSRKRNLPEREELNKKLSAAAKALQDKEKELEGARRRLAVLEKSLRQQVQAEVGRHRATAKKLYTLQCQHHKVLDTLMERERELESLQQYRRRGEGAGDSTSTTAASSRSPSLSARRKSGRKHSSESSDTNTSGIVSAIEAASSESRASLTLEASGRLPPISAGSRGNTEAADRASLRGSPEAPARRLRLRTHSSTNEGVEERRRVRRSRRSPRSCKEEGFIITPLATPTPSPVTTPEPSDLGSQPDANAVNDGASRPGHADHRRRLRLAASLRDARRNVSKEIGHEKDLDDDQGIPTGDRDSSGKREFSLIENYPPRERITLNGGSSGGSDSGSCTSSPPTKSVPHLNDSSIPSRLSQLDSPLPARAVPKRENTATSADLRTFSSLSKLDSSSSPKPTRSAVTP